jgi:hypothetical protein
MKRTVCLCTLFVLSCSGGTADDVGDTSDATTYADACDAMCSGLVVCEGMSSSDLPQCQAECEALLLEDYGSLNPGCLLFQLDCFECYHTALADACDEAASEAECAASCIPAEFCPYAEGE